MWAMPHFSLVSFLVTVAAFSLVTASAFSLVLVTVSSTVSVASSDEVSDTGSFTSSSVTVSVSDNEYLNLEGFKKHIQILGTDSKVSLVSTWLLICYLA